MMFGRLATVRSLIALPMVAIYDVSDTLVVLSESEGGDRRQSGYNMLTYSHATRCRTYCVPYDAGSTHLFGEELATRWSSSGRNLPRN